MNTRMALGQATQVTDLRAQYGLLKPAQWALRFTWPNGRAGVVFWQVASADGPVLPDIAGRKALDLITGEESTAGALGPDPQLVMDAE